MSAGVGQAAKNAMNVAATSRGGNYANAAVSAQDANAQAAQRAVQDGGVLRAQESAAAREQLGGVLAGIRSGDFNAMSGAQAQSGLALQQQQQNDAYQRAMLEGELAINQGQLQGSMAYGDAQLQARLAAQGINANAYEAQKNRSNALWGAVIGGGAGAAGSMLGKK